jgi:hypothetical protein
MVVSFGHLLEVVHCTETQKKINFINNQQENLKIYTLSSASPTLDL